MIMYYENKLYHHGIKGRAADHLYTSYRDTIGYYR